MSRLRLPAHPAWYAFEHWAVVYRRSWRGSVVTSVVTPVLFLAALGLGLGGLVSGGVDGVDYIDYLAPGLLASTAMQTAVGESTWPVLSALKWVKSYPAMLSTPLRVGDVLAGHLAWIGVRLLLVSTVFLASAALFGVWASPLVLLAVPVAVLTGLAFAAPTMAFSAALQSDSGFVLFFRLGVVPLFLFSGTFFPISQLPGLMQGLARITPLWHGVTLCRSLTLGRLEADAVGHAAFLLLWTLVGVGLARLAYRRALVR